MVSRCSVSPPAALYPARPSDPPAVLQPALISLFAFTLGYTLRPYLSPTPSRALSTSRPPSRSPAVSLQDDSDGATNTDSDAEDESAALASDLTKVSATTFDEVKLVLVVNDSLKMSKGKIAAQAGHATLACAMTLKEVNPRVGALVRSSPIPCVSVQCRDAVKD